MTSQNKQSRHFSWAPTLCLALLLLAYFIHPSFSVFAKSDWVEDDRINRQTENEEIERPIQPAIVNSGGSPMLQGTASMHGAVRLKPAGPISGQDMYRLENTVNQFLSNAQTNTVVPPTVFRGWLEKTHPEYIQASAQISSNAVIEVKGQWDDSAKTLHSLGIRHEIIKTKQLKDYSLDQTRVLVINCAGVVPKESLQAIRNFVIRGGYLLSTDWTLDNTLAKAFPGYVVWNGGKTPGNVVDANITDQNSTLLAGINIQRSTWKLDRESQMVRVLKPNVVRVIAVSARLAHIDPNQAIPGIDPSSTGILAVEFPFGRGHVLHLVGHFDNSSTSFRQNVLPDPTPDAGISLRQAIATNFIVEGLMANRK